MPCRRWRFRYLGGDGLGGTNPVANKNTCLGMVKLPITRPKPKGQVLVNFWFDIDDLDGILHIHAKEMGCDAEEVLGKIDYFYCSARESDWETEH